MYHMDKIVNLKVDDIDYRILKVLKENSKLSYRMTAKKLLLPVTTVHHRIRRLEKLGIIKGYKAIVDSKKLGNGICAYILIKTDYNALKEVKLSQQDLALKLKHKPEVEEVAMITGFKDIILKVRTKSVEELNNFVTNNLRNMDGVGTTETSVVLEELSN